MNRQLSCNVGTRRAGADDLRRNFMDTKVYGNVSVLEEADETVAQVRRAEYPIDNPKAGSGSPEIDLLEQEEAANARSTRIGVAYGFAAGVLIGIAQLAIIGNGVWSMWGAAMLPIYSGIGWALIGAIVGCGGILAGRKSTDRIKLPSK